MTSVSRWDPPLFGRGEERHPNSPELCSSLPVLPVLPVVRWLLPFMLWLLWLLWWPVAEDSDAAGWW